MAQRQPDIPPALPENQLYLVDPVERSNPGVGEQVKNVAINAGVVALGATVETLGKVMSLKDHAIEFIFRSDSIVKKLRP